MKTSLLLIGLMALCLPAMASAHATPVEYNPPASAVLAEPPASVRMRFSERPERSATFIEVLDAAGKRVNDGGIQIDASDPRTVSVPFPATGSGGYIVSWRVVSADDGHATSGAYSFAIGSGSAISPATFDIVHRLDVGDGLATWLSLLGHALAIGALVLAFVSRDKKRGSWIAAVGGMLIIIGEVWLLWIMQQSLEDVPALSTVSGKYIVLRALTGICIVIAACIRMYWRKVGDICLVALFILFAFLRARVSHAAASQELAVFSIGVNIAHLLFKDLWIGGIVACTIGATRAESQYVLLAREARLSRITAIGLAGGAVTGAYIVWLHLKSFDGLSITAWGGRAVTLTAFALMLLGLRLALEWRTLPAMRRISNGYARPKDQERAEAFRVWRIAETVAAVFVLMASAFALITTPPVRHAQRWSAQAESQGVHITLAEHPFENDRLLLTFETDDEAIQNAVVTATDTERGIGPLVLEPDVRFPGGFALPKDGLVRGSWTIAVTGTRAQQYDAVASFMVPKEATTATLEPANRSPWFTLFFVCIALCGIALAAWIFNNAAHHIGNEGGEPSYSRRDTWLATVFAATLMAYTGFHFIHQPFNGFKRACERAGFMWHESVPTRDGKIVSAVAVPGCMADMGLAQRHFPDRREFAYYMRPAGGIATLSTQPTSIEAGEESTLTFSLRDPSGQPLADIVPEHDKLLHVLILGQDGQFFKHVHPKETDVSQTTTSDFEVPFVFPQAGRYLIAIDYSVRARPGAQQFYVQVGGQYPMVAQPLSPVPVFSTGGYTVTLDTPASIRAGKETLLSLHVEKDGTSVTDMTTYLAAPMHFAIASEDLRKISHTHGELPRGWLEALLHPRQRGIPMHMPIPAKFGPDIDTYVTFPSAGTYVIFGQFMHQDTVQTVRFVVTVRSER